LGGAITKRAQLPFSAWLPAAIAAPTPVSSLVHSSTLVTAGVYVIIRFGYIFSLLRFSLLKILFLLTILLAGLFAITEIDFKKVVAISTLRQLGIMLFILSVGGTLLSFLHMIIHAFFKRILFLRTGSVIIQMSGRQDSRLYGGISSFTSFIYFSISCFCLAGFPFFIGFYSKELIISSISFNAGTLIYYIFVSSCLFTIMYSFRIFLMGYSRYFKYSSYYFTNERLFFIFTVFFIFVKC
jgi:NADH-ubiquinone oxidoreductase chain 5